MRRLLNGLSRYRRVLGFWAGMLLLGWMLGDGLSAIVFPELRALDDPMINKMVLGALVVYVVMAAIPFVPGAEIGFALLLLFGAAAAPVVYAGMVGALILAYLVARLVPTRTLSAGLAWLGLRRTAAMARRINQTPAHERENYLLERLPDGILKNACKNRYLALAILLNTPGNSLIGGGGGLAFAAGASGLYRFPQFLLTILIAVAPVPLFFVLAM